VLLWLIGIVIVLIVVYGLAVREVAAMPERAELARALLEAGNLASYVGFVVLLVVLVFAGWFIWRGRAERVGVWYY
jgi:heme/copper-type cytochrome/quinol oxidase subunit 2